jgi:dihydropteroate synthase
VQQRSFLTPTEHVEIGLRPLLMGVVNATPNSFSDAGELRTLADRVARAEQLVADGADLIDVGGQSGVTNEAEIPAELEAERVVPLVEALAARGIMVSVDTYRPLVAQAAIAAGAAIINDVSGLLYPEVAELCARSGAALVVMHTRALPKTRLDDPDRYDDVTADVVGFLHERIAVAGEHGLGGNRIIVDPGPDFAKTPAQTIALLQRLDEVAALGRPLLLAVSRKDFVGALTGRPPRERLAGTLAALAWGVDHGASILRVHDVREAADFLAVRAALRGEAEVARDLAITEEIRLQR